MGLVLCEEAYKGLEDCIERKNMTPWLYCLKFKMDFIFTFDYKHVMAMLKTFRKNNLKFYSIHPILISICCLRFCVCVPIFISPSILHIFLYFFLFN